MQSYFLSISVIVLACGSMQYLAGDLKLKKQVYFIASLCVVFALFAPIVTWLPHAVESLLPSVSVGTNDGELNEEYHAMLAEGTRAVEQSIGKQIENKLGINEKDLSVTISLSYKEIDNIYIKKIDVYLTRKTDGYLAKDITEYLRGLFACEVSVIVGGELYAVDA